MTFGEMLTPVRERYASWLGLDDADVHRDRDEDGDQVRAIQIVLRLERDAEPSHTRALALAASGCALLCLDDRSAPGGEWHEPVAAYCGGHIRKVTRRGRGAPWEATADLPGIPLAEGDTQLRVLVPGLLSELDKRVRKLQVGGTEIPADPGVVPPPSARPLLTCTVPGDLPMSTGKLMAQTGHAGMIAAALAAGDDPELLRRWYDAGCPAHVVTAGADAWQDLLTSLEDPAGAWREHRRIAVRDAGFTEIAPGTITVIASLDT